MLVLIPKVLPNHFPMRPFSPLIAIFLFVLTTDSVFATEIDSVRTLVTPVQCYGLRDGIIEVDTVFGGVKPYHYSLDGQSYTTNPYFDRLWAGEYTLYVRDGAGTEGQWPVRVKEPAPLEVRLQATETVVVSGETVSLRALTNIEPEFLSEIAWQPAALFAHHDTLRQSVVVVAPAEFSVIIRDKNGCMASDRLSIEVSETQLFFPNVIKPGSEEDAYFTVFSGEGVRRVVTLQIYSRSGAMVFEHRDFQPNAPQQGWSGQWEGQAVQSGVYPYLVVVEFLNGKKQRYEGTVTVVN